MEALFDDPFEWFGKWWEEAKALEVREPTSVALATADREGRPSVRIVLLKGWDEQGFVLYTNLESRKGRELTENPHAALCFHWDPLGRQVRVKGPVVRVEQETADAYWKTRARSSQIGGWASSQSAPLASRQELLDRVRDLEAEYPGDVPRPAHWSGVRIEPVEIEFWQQGEARLHDRFQFLRDGDGWSRARLNP